MDKRVDLTEEQRLYLQRIFDCLWEQDQWPTYRELDQWFTHRYPHLDIEEIWKSLPQGLTNHMDLNHLERRATLTVPAISLLKNNDATLSAFLQVLKLCVSAYLHASTEKPEISSESILQHFSLAWDKAVRQAGLLLLVEPHIWSSFSGPDPSGHWQCTLVREVRRFHDITTIEEYLKKRDVPHKISSASSIPNPSGISISAQGVQLHPRIHTKCWSLYTQEDYDNAIFNATKAIEVAVRGKASLPDDLVGANLITQAFKPDNPVLTYSSVKAEQEGIMALLRGMILVYKNPQSHRHVGVQNKSECLGILLLCSNLLYTIDKL